MTDQYSQVPAGWYEDPTQSGQLRYWDGANWSEHTQASSASADSVDSAATQPWESTTQSYGTSGNQVNATADYSGAYPATQTAPRAASDPGFFKSLFDLSFSDFVTIKFAKIIYVIGIVLNIIWWLGTALLGLIIAGVGASAVSYMGSNSGVAFGFVLPILWLLFGWIFALINIIILRVVIEFIVASVRTAQNTTHLLKLSSARADSNKQA